MSVLPELADAYPTTLTGFNQPATTYYARMFRQILIDLNMTPERWKALQKHYVHDPANKIVNVTGYNVERATMNKLRRRLAHPGMGRKNFMQAIKFLNPVDSSAVKDAFVLTWPNGQKSFHKLGPE